VRRIFVLVLAGLATAALTVTGVAQAESNGAGRGGASVKVLKVHPNPRTGCVSLEIQIRGWKMYPGRVGSTLNDADGGHYHVYVNGRYHTFGTNSTRARACGLAGGRTYRLQVVLARNDHSELNARSGVVAAILRERALVL